MENTNQKNLKFIAGYWCSQVELISSAKFDDYAEEMSEIISSDLPFAVATMNVIIGCKPTDNEELLSLVSAGHLEDIVDSILKQEDMLLAARITRSAYLRPLLPWVWTEERVAGLRKLGDGYKGKVNKLSSLPALDATYTVNQLTAFWCSIIPSKYISYFAQDAAKVWASLASDNPLIIKDVEGLALSAPDSNAEELVKNILSDLIGDERTLKARFKESEILAPYV